MVEDLCFTGGQSAAESNNQIELDQDDKVNQHSKIDGDLTNAFFQDNGKELMTILLKEPMKRGAKYRLGILYTGQIQDTTSGLFRTQYSVSDAIDGNCCQRHVLYLIKSL